MSTPATASRSTIAAQAHEGGSIGEMIISAIGRYPQRVAFIDGDRSVTYTELGRLIGKAMAAFRSLGLQRGDGVIQLSGNRVEVFVVMAAAYLLGLRSVTLHAMGGYDDHAYIVNDADAAVFISEHAHQQRSVALRAGCPGVPRWFAHGQCEGLNDFWELAGAMERRFEENGWPPAWRDGIYDFHHYHSQGHEALVASSVEGI